MLGMKGIYPTTLIDYLSHALPAKSVSVSPVVKSLYLHAEYIKVSLLTHKYPYFHDIMTSFIKKDNSHIYNSYI